jgi:uncharacterized protein
MSAAETILAHKMKRADTFAARFRGLMLKPIFPKEYDALLLTPCNSVHTLMMRFDIDVLFLDQEGTVVRVLEKMRPSRLSPVVREARHVIELASGTVAAVGIFPGDRLLWDETGKVWKQ